jgi:hypothetical protein
MGTQQEAFDLIIAAATSQYNGLLHRLLAQRDESGALGFPFDNKLLSLVPDQPGIYRIFDSDTESIYVGQTRTRTLRQRLRQHRDRAAQNGAELKRWLEESKRCSNGVKFIRNRCRVQFVEVDDKVANSWGLENGRVARSLFEAFTIAVLHPQYNYERWKYAGPEASTKKHRAG